MADATTAEIVKAIGGPRTIIYAAQDPAQNDYEGVSSVILKEPYSDLYGRISEFGSATDSTVTCAGAQSTNEG